MINMLLSIFAIPLLILANGIRSQNLDDELCQCGRTQTRINYRIFNGTPVHPNHLSFVANVFFNTQIVDSKIRVKNHRLLFNSLCTAVILNSKWLLSAQSGINLNLFRQLRESFFVGAGSTDLFKIYSDPNLYRLIEEIYEYQTESGGLPPSKHDIVLIEIRTPFELGPIHNIYAACLFDEDRRSFEQAIVSGFGRRSATTKLDEKTEKITIDEIPIPRRRAIATGEGVPSNSSASADRNDLEFNSVRVKMTAPSRYLMVTSMNQVDCGLNKQNESEEAYFICLRHQQTSTCIGDAGAPMLTFNSPSERLLVTAIATPLILNASAIDCGPDKSTRFVLVKPHLDWIRNRTEGPLCASEGKPSRSNLFGHVFVIMLSSLVLLVVFIMFLRETRRRSLRSSTPERHLMLGDRPLTSTLNETQNEPPNSNGANSSSAATLLNERV